MNFLAQLMVPVRLDYQLKSKSVNILRLESKIKCCFDYFEVTLHRTLRIRFLEVVNKGWIAKLLVDRISWPFWYSVQPNFASSNLSLDSKFRKSTEAAKKMVSKTGLDSMEKLLPSFQYSICKFRSQIFRLSRWFMGNFLAWTTFPARKSSSKLTFQSIVLEIELTF